MDASTTSRARSGRAVNRLTISDVARECGVAKSTVSKALNFPPEQCTLNEATRQRVLAIAQSMGYSPSWRAKVFSHGRTNTIGFVQRAALPVLQGDVWIDMVAGMTQSLQDRGCDAQVVPITHESTRSLHLLSDGRFDGCVVFQELLPEVEEVVRAANLPIVLLNAESSDEYASVVPDDEMGATLIANHLAELGHRDIAFFDTHDNPRHFSFQRRYQGLVNAMKTHGGSVNWVRAPLEQIAERLQAAEPRVTAVVTYDDHVGIRLLHALWRAGISVPKDLSLATFNDSGATRYSIPPMTTVNVPSREMGQHAVRLLLEAIESKQPVRPEKSRHKETLIVRESTAAPKR